MTLVLRFLDTLLSTISFPNYPFQASKSMSVMIILYQEHTLSICGENDEEFGLDFTASILST